MKLTDTFVKRKQGNGQIQKYSDGDGLFLYITPQGGKSRRMGYRFMGISQILFTEFKSHTDELLSLDFKICQCHMIICPFYHFQTPWRLEQAAYGVQITELVAFYSLRRQQGSPKRIQAYLLPWSTTHKRHQMHTPCGMPMLDALLCAAAWAKL